MEELKKKLSSSEELTDIEEKLAEEKVNSKIMRKRMEELIKKISSKTSSSSSSRTVTVTITSRTVLKSLVESLDSSGRLTRDQKVAGFILHKGDKLRSSSKSLKQGVTKVEISASKHITLVFDVLKISSVSRRRRRQLGQASTNTCKEKELYCKTKCENNSSRAFACSYSSVTGTKYSCSCSSSSSSSEKSSKKVVEESINSSSVVKHLEARDLKVLARVKSLEAKVQGCCGKVATSARRRRRFVSSTTSNSSSSSSSRTSSSSSTSYRRRRLISSTSYRRRRLTVL